MVGMTTRARHGFRWNRVDMISSLFIPMVALR
jgi:hypothetical protein